MTRQENPLYHIINNIVYTIEQCFRTTSHFFIMPPKSSQIQNLQMSMVLNKFLHMVMLTLKRICDNTGRAMIETANKRDILTHITSVKPHKSTVYG